MFLWYYIYIRGEANTTNAERKKIMKTTKTVTIKETMDGYEVRNNFQTVYQCANYWDALDFALTLNKPIKKVVAW